ncbi:MAG: 3'(2'), 5'-bisphosphate nucleotidase [Flavobacterium sp.]|jgi:3'(2'), 5'-bisphosphate nucleotidase
MNKLLNGLSDISRRAGAAILEIYEKEDHGIEIKADDSPLTAADLAANKIIIEGLEALAPGIPILSEESDEISYSERKQWKKYFLVDPLDGTKEFINRNGEFTVNIALIENTVAVVGVVYVPCQDKLYVGDLNGGHAYVESKGVKEHLFTRPLAENDLKVVASRRHGSETMQKCMDELSKCFTVSTLGVGSSLKFCIIAEGKADLYPRLAPTSEWDTAAAQAVVEAAGGLVVDADFKPLRYNTKENILNPFFYVLADPTYDWASALN